MELKTKVIAQEGKQDLVITREFELPVELLFKAYTEANLIEQWMNTSVVELNNNRYGFYLFETTDPKGNKMKFRGSIHEFIPNKQIIRTFEFEGMPFGVQLEILDFIAISDDRCSLKMHSIFQSIEHRDQQLKLPFAYGISMAHNKLEEIIKQS